MVLENAAKPRVISLAPFLGGEGSGGGLMKTLKGRQSGQSSVEAKVLRSVVLAEAASRLKTCDLCDRQFSDEDFSLCPLCLCVSNSNSRPAIKSH